MVIYVTFFVGNHTIPIKVEAYDAIDNVKTIITLEEGIPLNQQILTFAGQDLGNGFTLSDYNIQNADTLHMQEKVTDNTNIF